MNRVLVIGAGMISKPLVRYLLELEDCYVTMASRTVSKADDCIDCHPSGEAICLDCEDDVLLEELVSNSEIVVSLVPYAYHPKIAKVCIKFKRHLVTTSYISEEMKFLNDDAKNAGVLLLNECGLDPGMDHMSAMRVIHRIEANGGKIVSFRSSTGALPSHEANTNPFGYKFSWSPRGVLLASKNPSRWLQDGRILSYPGDSLFENYFLQDVPFVGTFENYPNRDSLPYKEIYGLKDAKTVYRGTFRMTGWCETMKKIVELGWLSEKKLESFNGSTYLDLTRSMIGVDSDEDVVKATASFLGLKVYSTVIKRLKWLGLFDDIPLPEDKKSPLDYLNILNMNKMLLGKDEKDMIVMHHEFEVIYGDKKEYITSTLVDYGVPRADSAVARTVALPAAIAVKLIINGKINKKGVYIPIVPEIYNPILDELELMDIKFKEEKRDI